MLVMLALVFLTYKKKILRNMDCLFYKSIPVGMNCRKALPSDKKEFSISKFREFPREQENLIFKNGF